MAASFSYKPEVQPAKTDDRPGSAGAVDSGAARDLPAALEASLFRASGDTVQVSVAIPVPIGEDPADPPIAESTFAARPGWAPAHLRLLGKIAGGGMGTVFKAHDRDLGRDIALKVLHEAHVGQEELRQRFAEEAHITGRLQHPGIVPVYEAGEFSDQRPYFTMKLVKGQTLARLLAERRPDELGGRADQARWLSVFEQVCRTMAYAHAQGVIHRDLKPANVMVDGSGNVRVLDWGLAKVMRKDEGGRMKDEPDPSGSSFILPPSSLVTTRLGVVLGTPAYMPPEQAQGEVGQLDARCDVFGLGVILCEILTGRPPYVGAEAAQVLRRAAQADLEDAFARLDRCGADVGLIALAKQCLAPRRDDRPRDAGVLVRELGVHRRSTSPRPGRAERVPVQADQELLARLEAARLWGVTPVENRLDRVGAAAAYAAAFREAGLGKPREDPDTVARRIRDSAVAGEVLSAVYDWALAVGDGPVREWLLAVARRTDPGSWNDRFHDAAVWRNRTTLERLARQVDVAAVAPSTLWALGVGLRRHGANAVPLLQGAQERYPDSFALKAELADALYDAGRRKEAIGFYRAALALRPESCLAHANLGSALYHEHRLDEALSAYQRAIALCPAFAHAHRGLGRALYDQGRFEEAVAEFREVLALGDTSAADHYNLGTALACTGRPEEATAAFRQTVELDPHWPRARHNLAWVSALSEPEASATAA
jgi:serine/threonine protein kinase/Flp pilus assembly protein TadD